MIEEYKKEFCEKYQILQKVYVDENTNKELNKKVLEENFDYDIDSYEDYYCDKKDNGKEYKFYKLKIAKISDEDLNKVMMFENNTHLRRIDKNLNFIAIFLKVCIVIDIIVAIVCLIVFS